jgi:alpha-beta hydrolase superfamily lysophospholipase
MPVTLSGFTPTYPHPNHASPRFGQAGASWNQERDGLIAGSPGDHAFGKMPAMPPERATLPNHESTRLFMAWETLEQLCAKAILHLKKRLATAFAQVRLQVGQWMAQAKETAIYGLGQIYQGPISLPVYNLVERQALFSPVSACSLQTMDADLQRAIKRTTFFPVPELGNIELSAWHIPAQYGKPTILIHHGRKSNISQQGPLLSALKAKGFGVFIYDYPGFGKSEGVPQIETIHHAANAAQAELIRRGVPIGEQVVLGHSLGGAVAVDQLHRLNPSANSKEKPRALVVVNTLSRAEDVLQSRAEEYRAFNWVVQRYPGLLKRFPMLRSFFSLSDKIRDVARKEIPILVMHADNDAVFPEKLGRDLHNQARRAVKPAGKSLSYDIPVEYRTLTGTHSLKKPLCEQVANHLEAFLKALPAESFSSRWFPFL